MLRRLCAFAVLFALASGLAAEPISLVRVWPRWYDLDSFQRISEYFTGRQNPGDYTILRTQPEIRPGYYFLVRVKNKGQLVQGTKFVISVILPGHPDPRTYVFPADVPAKGKVYQLGLTGSDWPGKKILPLAWKVDLVDASGREIATQQSFLWSKPN